MCLLVWLHFVSVFICAIFRDPVSLSLHYIYVFINSFLQDLIIYFKCSSMYYYSPLNLVIVIQFNLVENQQPL